MVNTWDNIEKHRKTHQENQGNTEQKEHWKHIETPGTEEKT